MTTGAQLVSHGALAGAVHPTTGGPAAGDRRARPRACTVLLVADEGANCALC